MVAKPLFGLFCAGSALSLAWFIYQSLRVNGRKPSDLKWRGIIKLVALSGLPESLKEVYQPWFISICIFFSVVSISVGYLVWASDHSFLVIIFPLFFYYFFARYFLWEKNDLTD